MSSSSSEAAGALGVAPPGWKETAAAAALMAVAVAFFYLKLTQHPTDVLTGIHAGGHNDLTSWFLRSRETPGLLFSQGGGWGLWDPYLGCGMPLHGNPQSGLFYPPGWICYALGAERCLSWLLVAHFWLSGLGTFCFCRRLALSRPASLAAGWLACALPYPVAHLAEGHVAQIFTVAWFPWILLAFERFLTSGGRKWTGVSILLTLSFLAGHVQELYYLVLILTGIVGAQCLLQLRRGERRLSGHLLMHWVLAGVVCVGLSSIDLIPILLNSGGTARGGRLPMELAGAGLTFSHFRQLLNPFALGLPGENTARYGFYWCFLCYFGVVPLLLSSVGTLTNWRRPAARRLFWTGLISFVFALGKLTPLYRVAWLVIPEIGAFRMPSRALFITSVVVAVLAAFGLDLFFRKRNETGSFGRWGTVLTGCLLIGIPVWELGRHANRILATIPPENIRRDSELSRFLIQNLQGHRVLATQSLYSDLEAVRDGQRRVRGYEPVAQLRLAWLIDALFEVDDGKLDFAGFQDADLSRINDRVADLAGVKYFVSVRKQRIRDGWSMVLSGRLPPQVVPREAAAELLPFHVYENQHVLPRAFLVGEIINTAGVAVSDRIDMLEQLDPRRQVLLEHMPDIPDERCGFTPVKIVEEVPDRITVETVADKPGVLVLTELFHPGWTATVDGAPAELLAADIAFRGVVVPAGTHRVEFRFICPGQRSGMMITLGTLLALLIRGWIVRLRPTADQVA